MDLNSIFSVFVNWQTGLLCLAIYIITYVSRTVVETSFKQFAQRPIWYELLLPLGPIATGVILALVAKKFPWPDPLAASMSARIMYSSICGLFNGWMYTRVKAWIGVAADSGNDFAAKVLKRPPSDRVPPMSASQAPPAMSKIPQMPVPKDPPTKRDLP